MQRSIFDRCEGAYFENENIKIWKEEEVIYSLYKQNAIVTLDAAKEIVKQRLLFQNFEEFPFIAFLSQDVKIITPEARKYFAMEGYEGISKMAIVTNSTMKAILANIYITIDKPVKPTKLFKSEEEALIWLKEPKFKNSSLV